MTVEVGCIRRENEKFPESLLSLKPGLKKLWYRGDWKGESWKKTVAVVGSRKMSRYGKQVIAEVVSRLVEKGYTIVSGLMYGVDQEAHRVTLACGGRAVGVLGYGIFHKSEEGAWKLGGEIVEQGGLILSEYEGDVRGQTWTFPQRNRIVVAISELVIIIEAGAKSGSLNTASWARRMKKPLYAVPGNIFSLTSMGTNALIARGEAKALTLETLIELTGTTKPIVDEKMTKLSQLEREVWTRLKLDGPSSVNELGRKLSREMGEVLAHLAQMELKEVVKEERGVWEIV